VIGAGAMDGGGCSSGAAVSGVHFGGRGMSRGGFPGAVVCLGIVLGLKVFCVVCFFLILCARAKNSGKHGAGQVCQICGDGVGTAADGELFTACDVCGFPVCRPCYEYERKDGTQACPQCKTKYKRHKGNALLAISIYFSSG